MPTYDYICNDCIANGVDDPCFESRYSFTATPDEIVEYTRCPTCNGVNVDKLVTSPAHVRVRGGSWEEFRARNIDAIKRDLHLHQLEHKDPYAHMRVPGETDYIKDKLKSERTKKPDRKYFT